MSLTPAPFLRFGFALLAVCVALSIWIGQSATLGFWAWVPAAVAFIVVGGIGEAIFRRLATPAEIRADLSDRGRNRD